MTQEQISRKAYQIYLYRQRNNIMGDSIHDWYEAEKELKIKQEEQTGWLHYGTIRD